MSGAEPGRRVVLDGVRFDALSEREVVNTVLAAVERGEGGTIITPNVDILRQLRRPRLRHLADSARIVVADGHPVVLASRIQGTPLPERVTGSALIYSLAEEALRRDRRVLLLGGASGSAAAAADTLLSLVPAAGSLIGHHCPPYGFESSPAHMDEIRRVMTAHRPHIVFVGLGFPKQDLLGAELARDYPASWFMGCGAAIDFLGGAFDRAPQWMQNSGLEWVFRLLSEPTRLFKRYVVHDIPYALRLLVGAYRTRLLGDRKRRGR